MFLGGVMVCVPRWCNGLCSPWCNGLFSSVV